MKSLYTLLILVGISSATISISDPSDFADLAGDAADNTLVSDYNVPPATSFLSSLKST